MYQITIQRVRESLRLFGNLQPADSCELSPRVLCSDCYRPMVVNFSDNPVHLDSIIYCMIRKPFCGVLYRSHTQIV